jgi:hypothetical protein
MATHKQLLYSFALATEEFNVLKAKTIIGVED